MKNFKGVISFVFVTMIAFVFGFNAVRAQEAPATVTVTANNQTADGWWIWPHSLVKYNAADNSYVFCLDSGLDVDLNVPLKYDANLYSDKLTSVNKIISKAYSFGLGSSNQWGISDKDFYGITQSVVWKAIHGEVDKGYTDLYEDWIVTNGYEEIFNTLYNAINEEVATPYVILDGDDTLFDTGSNYMVSNEIKVITNVPEGVTLTLSVDGGEISVNKSTFAAGSVVVKNNDVVMVRVVKSSSNTVSASISVNSDSFNNGYNAYFYDTATLGKQNIGIVVPVSTNVSDSMEFNGSFTDTKNIKVTKTDATNQEELDGAEMKVYELNNDEDLFSWTSKKGELFELKNLVVGQIYMLEEVAAPTGYDKLNTKVYFMVNKDGKVATCKTDVVESNSTCEAMSTDEILNIKNKPSKKEGKVIITKKDITSGEELQGAHLQIIDENGNVVASWDSTDKAYEITLPVGVYYLEETLPVPDYEPDMIIEGDVTSKYKFEVTEDGINSIDVYNKLKVKKIDVPITGMNVTGMYIMGGLVTLAGTSVVVYAKKKENM